jgi:hypothetical protein
MCIQRVSHRAIHMIFKVRILSTICFTQSENTNYSTDSDCLTISKNRSDSDYNFLFTFLLKTSCNTVANQLKKY